MELFLGTATNQTKQDRFRDVLDSEFDSMIRQFLYYRALRPPLSWRTIGMRAAYDAVYAFANRYYEERKLSLIRDFERAVGTRHGCPTCHQMKDPDTHTCPACVTAASNASVATSSTNANTHSSN